MIAELLGEKQVIRMIEKCYDSIDNSAMRAEELMAELRGEEEKREKASKRNKRKKESSKLKKLAVKQGITV